MLTAEDAGRIASEIASVLPAGEKSGLAKIESALSEFLAQADNRDALEETKKNLQFVFSGIAEYLGARSGTRTDYSGTASLAPTPWIWKSGSFIPWGEALVHVLTHSLHYGSAAFEGIRFYETPRGPAVFRLKEHIDRLYYSGSALRMQIPWPKEELVEACLELVRRNGLSEGYLRPLVYYGYGKMGVNPKNVPVDAAIASWKWGNYVGANAADVVVSRFIRIHPKSSVADAKLAGHYVNSIMGVQDINGTKYHEAVFLDYKGNVAEGSGENFFLVKDGVLHTPSLGSILAGITRNTIIEMAKDLKLEVVERDITLEEAFSADEAFFTGTAAEVTPIRSINDKPLGKTGDVGPVTEKLRKLYADSVRGKIAQYEKYLSYAVKG